MYNSMATLFIVCFAAFPAFAQSFKPIIKPIGMAEKIVIRGYNGKLQIVETNTSTLRVEASKEGSGTSFDQWTYQVRPNQNVIEVVVKGPSEQEDWQKLRDKKMGPKFNLKVMAPARPMEVQWVEGQVVVDKWPAPLNIQMSKGDIKITNSEGPLMAQLIKGRLRVVDHNGNVEAQTFKGQASFEKTKGVLTVHNHSARLQVLEHNGPIELSNHSGTLNIKDSESASQIRNVSGVVRLKNHNGSLNGEFEKGLLDAHFKTLQSVVVNSDEAAITVDAPKTSGARVNLRSEKGGMRAPLFLGKNRKGRWTERKGRLKGKEQGSVKIISKYGDIVLK